MRILLISTYELGRQPFGLSSPGAWLREAGHEVFCQDLSQEPLSADLVRRADRIALYLPMHTATRIAVRAMQKIRELNPEARVAAYGLYAPMNAPLLRSIGVERILGPEFEAELVRLASGAETDPNSPRALPRLHFRVPDRRGLPPLGHYSRLRLPNGETRVAGATEASRGCLHRCRHCPIVPVYDGQLRIVQPEVVLADVRQQVEAGAEHISFADPDFFNGLSHSLRIVEALHQEHPGLSYDVTIKVEHLRRYRQHLGKLKETGCAFVTSAVESLDNRVLGFLQKGHTRQDAFEVFRLMRELSLPLVPTFVPFTPWTTLEGYVELLETILSWELVEHVAPVQLTIRLLIPSGSKLLELAEIAGLVGEFDASSLVYPWRHPDPRVDELQQELEALVKNADRIGWKRSSTFLSAWELAASYAGRPAPAIEPILVARAAIPQLTEPWYC